MTGSGNTSSGWGALLSQHLGQQHLQRRPAEMVKQVNWAKDQPGIEGALIAAGADVAAYSSGVSNFSAVAMDSSSFSRILPAA